MLPFANFLQNVCQIRGFDGRGGGSGGIAAVCRRSRGGGMFDTVEVGISTWGEDRGGDLELNEGSGMGGGSGICLG